MDFSTILNDTLDDRRKVLFTGKVSKELLGSFTDNEVREYFGYEELPEYDKQVEVKTEEDVTVNDESGNQTATEYTE